MRFATLINVFKNPYVQASLRHLLTSLGPVIAIVLAHDDPWTLFYALIQPESMAYVGGVLVALVGLIASFADKKMSRKKDVIK